MRCLWQGFGDTDQQFAQILTSDGLPPNVANRSYSDTYQSYYKQFRQFGLDGPVAWDLMETLDRDAGATKALQAGVPPDLVVQAWRYELFKRGSAVSARIVGGGNPLQAIQDGLRAIGIVPVTSQNTGPSQAPVSDYIRNLPDGVLPGAPYSIRNTAGGTTTYYPDWFDPNGPPTPEQTAASQAQITDPNYYLFPSGNSSAGATSNTAGGSVGAAIASLVPPISLGGVQLSSNAVLWLGGGLAALFLLSRKS